MKQLWHRIFTASARLGAASAVVLMTAGVAVAQDGNEPASAPASEEPLLAGPKVEDDPAGGRLEVMSATREEGMQGQYRPSIHPQLWLRELRQCDLSDELRATIDGIVREYEANTRAYMQEHGDELRELAEQFKPLGVGEIEMRRELRQQLNELRAKAPRFDEYQQRIWEALSPAQRSALTARLDEMLQTIEQEQANRRAINRQLRQERRQNRNRADASVDEFDELGRRRMQFLLKHQSGASQSDSRSTRRRNAPPEPRRPPSDR